MSLLGRAGGPLRYSHFSDLQRKISIKKQIEKCLSRDEGGKLNHFLAEKYFWASTSVLDKLIDLEDAASWGKILDDLVSYLDYLKDQEMKTDIKHQACLSAQTLFGLWLIKGIDTRRLHILIHDLNHQRDAARKAFDQNQLYFYPILVSALFNIPVYYHYIDKSGEGSSTESFSLRGKYQLLIPERGLNPDNYKISMERDAQYLSNPCDHGTYTFDMNELSLFEKAVRQRNPGFSTPGTEPQRYASVKKAAEKLKGAYMLFSQDSRMSGGKVDTLLNLFGREFPWITQIGRAEMSEVERQNIMTYFIEGVNPSDLHWSIIDFYAKIHEIAHEQKYFH